MRDATPEKADYIFCKLMTKEKPNFELAKSILRDKVNRVQELEVIDNAIVTKIIFESDDVNIEQNMYENVPAFEDKINNDNDSDLSDDIKDKIRKIISDFEKQKNLAFIEKNYILKSAEKRVNVATKKAELAAKEADETKEKVELAAKKADDAKEKSEKATDNNITILGIFTAITFAVFGGIQTFNSLFSKMNMASAPIKTYGFVLSTGAVFGLILYGIIIVLFYGISKLTNKGKSYSIDEKLKKIILIALAIMFSVGTLIVIFCN